MPEKKKIDELNELMDIDTVPTGMHQGVGGQSIQKTENREDCLKALLREDFPYDKLIYEQNFSDTVPTSYGDILSYTVPDNTILLLEKIGTEACLGDYTDMIFQVTINGDKPADISEITEMPIGDRQPISEMMPVELILKAGDEFAIQIKDFGTAPLGAKVLYSLIIGKLYDDTICG